jgi:hypothetical protein
MKLTQVISQLNDQLKKVGGRNDSKRNVFLGITDRIYSELSLSILDPLSTQPDVRRASTKLGDLITSEECTQVYSRLSVYLLMMITVS